jgi:hypothetical protein
MAHYEFEAVIPVEHVMHLITLVRENGSNLLGVKGEVLTEVGCICGELGAYIGPSDIPQPMGAAPTPETLAAACDAVEAELGVKGEGLEGINIALIIQIINLIRMILSQM